MIELEYVGCHAQTRAASIGHIYYRAEVTLRHVHAASSAETAEMTGKPQLDAW